MFVGEKDLDGEESFDIMICTPSWLITNKTKDSIILGLHYLIVFQYDYEKIYKRLKNIIDNIEGDSWEIIGQKLSYIGKWEFENYKD